MNICRTSSKKPMGSSMRPSIPTSLTGKVEALNNKMLALVNESVSSGDGIEAHESEFMTLSQEAELLKQRNRVLFVCCNGKASAPVP